MMWQYLTWCKKTPSPFFPQQLLLEKQNWSYNTFWECFPEIAIIPGKETPYPWSQSPVKNVYIFSLKRNLNPIFVYLSPVRQLTLFSLFELLIKSVAAVIFSSLTINLDPSLFLQWRCWKALFMDLFPPWEKNMSIQAFRNSCSLNWV